MAKSDKIRYILMIIVAVLGVWLAFDHVANFAFPEFIYKRNPEIDLFIGCNVVSVWADFSFFTYITIILWATWALLYVFCKLSGARGSFINFLERDTVVSFVFVNYVLTVTMYTAFKICSGDFTFGFIGNNSFAWHNFGTNIIAHYIIFGFAVYVFLKTSTIRGSMRGAFTISGAVLSIYYCVVKIAGEFAYKIRWFPYVIFDTKSFGAGFGVTNYAVCVILLILACMIILCLYMLAFAYCIKFKRKQTFMEIV